MRLSVDRRTNFRGRAYCPLVSRSQMMSFSWTDKKINIKKYQNGSRHILCYTDVNIPVRPTYLKFMCGKLMMCLCVRERERVGEREEECGRGAHSSKNTKIICCRLPQINLWEYPILNIFFFFFPFFFFTLAICFFILQTIFFCISHIVINHNYIHNYWTTGHNVIVPF